LQRSRRNAAIAYGSPQRNTASKNVLEIQTHTGTSGVGKIFMMIDYTEQVIAARSIEDLWTIHCEAMGDYGFDRLLYGFTRFRTATSLGSAEDFLILTNHDDAYMRPFLKDMMFLQAPTVRWALENSGTMSWNWIKENPEMLTDAEKRVVELNRAHGINAGYTISFKDVSIRSKGAIGLIAREGMHQSEVDELWQRDGRQITAMNNIAHLRITSLPYSSKRKVLTHRQREALEWVGEGKTTQDIATIMGLTTATVEKHLRLARVALDVETTAQAVLKASFQNQIFVIPGSV